MTTINNFISNFSGGARPNLFRVDLTFAGSQMQFLCKGAQIPGRSIGAIDVRYLNNIVKVAGDNTYQDWSVTIINDTDFAIRQALEAKMDEIKWGGGTEGATDLSYFTEAFVAQLDQNAKDIATYKFYNLWPNDIAAIDLSFDTSDTVEEYQVTFSFSHWEKIG